MHGGHNKLDNYYFWNMDHYLQSFNVQNLMQIDDVSKVLLHLQGSCGFLFFFSNIFFYTKGAPVLLKIENDIIIDD
jgi:hypothetical protein